jgi:hypothetical protein
MTKQYVEKLVTAYPRISEVWLFGSRANDQARPDSDWDYLAFCDEARVMSVLHNDARFNDPNVDLMFVGPGLDEALKPWPRADGSWKTLGLGSAPGGINWKVISDNEAQYIVYRDRRPGSVVTVPQLLKAALIYRRDLKHSA